MKIQAQPPGSSLFFLDVLLKYKYGRLVLEIPLTSRNEKCLFFLRPMLMNVGDLISDLQREDPGAIASVLSKGRTLASCEHTWSITFLECCQSGLRYLFCCLLYGGLCVWESEAAYSGLAWCLNIHLRWVSKWPMQPFREQEGCWLVWVWYLFVPFWQMGSV